MAKYLLLSLLFYNFGSYFYSVFGVFKKYPNQKMLSYRLLQLVSVLTWVACLYVVTEMPATPYIWMAIAAEICFGSLYWWAARLAKKGQFTIAYSLDLPQIMVNAGPYKFIRHPCYTAYLGSYFTVALYTQDPAVIALSVLMLIIYWRAAKMEEAKFMCSELAPNYQTYRSRTGMFLPKVKTGSDV